MARDFRAADGGEGCTINEFGMLMRPTELYVEVVKCPLESITCALPVWKRI